MLNNMYDNIQHPSTSYILLHCIKAWKKYIIVVHGDIDVDLYWLCT